MTHLSLFSGIGGIDLAAEWAGFPTVAFVERDKFCQRVLSKHWPEVPIYDDITTFDAEPFRGIDLVSGGFPCQDISAAGKQKGLSGERSGLWFEMLRVIEQARPAWVLAENVANLVSMGIDTCLLGLESAGYSARAVIVPASAVGAVHRRERCFIVARNADSERCKELVNREPNGTPDIDGGIVAYSEGFRERKPTNEANPFSNGWKARHESSGIGSVAIDSNRIADLQACEGAVAIRSERNAREMSGCRCYRPIASGEWRTWSVKPVLRRDDDGLRDRVDRLRALGNAVVPAQVYPILEAIAMQIKSGVE